MSNHYEKCANCGEMGIRHKMDEYGEDTIFNPCGEKKFCGRECIVEYAEKQAARKKMKWAFVAIAIGALLLVDLLKNLW